MGQGLRGRPRQRNERGRGQRCLFFKPPNEHFYILLPQAPETSCPAFSQSHCLMQLFSLLLTQPWMVVESSAFLGLTHLFLAKAYAPVFSCSFSCDFSCLKSASEEMDLWSHSKLNDLSTLPGLGLEPCMGESRYFPRWLGTWPPCDVPSTGGVGRSSESESTSVQRGGQFQSRTTPSQLPEQGCGKKSQRVLTALISLILQGHLPVIDSPKRQIHAFAFWGGL